MIIFSQKTELKLGENKKVKILEFALVGPFMFSLSSKPK